MALITVESILAGKQPARQIGKAATPAMVAGRPQSLWGLGGAPGAGSFDTTLAGVALSSSAGLVNGQIPHFNPVSGEARLVGFNAIATQPGMLLICDRLWHNGGFTITSAVAQALASAAFPARDDDGTINGKGVQLGLEVSAACGAAAPTITVGYTNEAGVAGRSAVNSFATANSPGAGAFFPIGLQAGDRGVKSVESLTLSASWVSGTINLVAYRVLASLPLSAGNVPNSFDALTGEFPRLFDGAVPFLIFIPSATTSSNISGVYQEAHG